MHAWLLVVGSPVPSLRAESLLMVELKLIESSFPPVNSTPLL